MIIYSIYIKDILLKIAAYILMLHIFTYELGKIQPATIQVNINGTIVQYEYDISTFYFEV